MTALHEKQSAEHKFLYKWYLKDGYPAKGIEHHKSKVFSCFACGGGSTMGYKLAGYDVIGCNEIDPKMMEVYRENHNPKYSFLEPIQTFKDKADLPEELFQLDILDGSPPCSSFSMSGNREKDWGKKKKFREGQAKQVLDNLFFDFIDLAKRLQPKVVVAENVEGLLLGKAKAYVRQIYREFDLAGYYCQHWLLDASKMGVPQRRKRVFFICLRKDLAGPFLEQVDLFTIVPGLDLWFREKDIKWGEIQDKKHTAGNLEPGRLNTWKLRKYGDKDLEITGRRELNKPNLYFSSKILYTNRVPNTVTGDDKCVLFDMPRTRNDEELKLCGSFPMDFEFGVTKVSYLVGMSVPPVMTAQIASRIYEQWLSKINLK